MAGQSCQTLVLRASRATVLAPNRMCRPGVSLHIGREPSAPTPRASVPELYATWRCTDADLFLWVYQLCRDLRGYDSTPLPATPGR